MLQQALLGLIAAVQPFFQGYQYLDLQAEQPTPPMLGAQETREQIEANEIGLAILEPLRKLDEVAFMRFASVYQGWESLADFEAAINVLRANREYTESGESFDLDETKRLTDR